jgi:hypothetical protein
MARSSSDRATGFLWCVRNRETGAVTVAQAPNLVPWIIIATSGTEAARG